MYTNYEIKNGKVFAYDKFGYSKNMKLTSNIKEILICENDIEKMKEIINGIEYDIIESKKKRKSKGLYHFSLASLWGTSTTLQFVLNNNWIVGLLFSANAVLNTGLGLSYVIPESKHIKINKAKIDLINKYLREERLKITELEQSNNQNLNYIEQSGIVPTSKKIDELRDKLNILHDYMTDRRHYIKHYKEGTLKNMVKVLEYDSEEKIKFLEELIKEDLGNSTKEDNKDIIYYKI